MANSYCYMFADASAASIDSRALLKLTPSEVRVIKDALNNGLKSAYGDDRYVYYVSDNGSNLDWHGFNGDSNIGVSAPYVVCPSHNSSTWEAFQGNISGGTEPPITDSWIDTNPDIYGDIKG